MDNLDCIHACRHWEPSVGHAEYFRTRFIKRFAKEFFRFTRHIQTSFVCDYFIDLLLDCGNLLTPFYRHRNKFPSDCRASHFSS